MSGESNATNRMSTFLFIFQIPDRFSFAFLTVMVSHVTMRLNFDYEKSRNFILKHKNLHFRLRNVFLRRKLQTKRQDSWQFVFVMLLVVTLEVRFCGDSITCPNRFFMVLIYFKNPSTPSTLIVNVCECHVLTHITSIKISLCLLFIDVISLLKK